MEFDTIYVKIVRVDSHFVYDRSRSFMDFEFHGISVFQVVTRNDRENETKADDDLTCAGVLQAAEVALCR